MIDKKFAKQLLERLSGLNWYPRDNAEATKDLGVALMAAHSDAVALSVVDDWVATYPDAPKPSQLRALINTENEKVETRQQQATANCKICNGTGQELVMKNGYSGARNCVCRGGE